MTTAEQDNSHKDRIYRTVVRTLEAFEAVVRQQPDNLAGLERYRAQLETSLRSMAMDLPAIPEARTAVPSIPTQKDRVGTAHTIKASGPLTPDSTPLPPGRIEQREKATAQSHIPVGPYAERMKDKRLSSDIALVHSQTRIALEELRKLQKLLKESKSNSERIEGIRQHIAVLRSAIESIGQKPQATSSGSPP